MEEMRNAYIILVWKLQGTPHGSLRHKWEDNNIYIGKQGVM
jgi:hypothetical protein